jgi:hypothetical protein
MASTPRLSRRVAQAGLPPAARHSLRQALLAVASANGEPDPAQSALILKILGPEEEPGAAEPAPIESLWPHAELFVTAAVTVATADGRYDIDEARIVATLAHNLGLSAHQLSALESKLLRAIRDRGVTALTRDQDVPEEATEATEPESMSLTDPELLPRS